jgi:glucosamine--fructose-6-phosphate aminotransferase (isomerizing)
MVGLARARGTIYHAREAELIGVMSEVPSRASELLNHDERIQQIAAEIALARDVLISAAAVSIRWRSRARSS